MRPDGKYVYRHMHVFEFEFYLRLLGNFGSGRMDDDGRMKKGEETGELRENPRTRCLFTTKPTWHEPGSNWGPHAPEVSALPLSYGRSVLVQHKSTFIQGVPERMVQTLGSDYSHQTRKKVPLKKFRNLISFSATAAQNYSSIVTNSVISRHVMV